MKLSLSIATVVFVMSAGSAHAAEVYLDKMNKTLDNWWNALDDACRGEPGGSEASDLACDQRLALDKFLKKRGCRNVYPSQIRMPRHIGSASAEACPMKLSDGISPLVVAVTVVANFGTVAKAATDYERISTIGLYKRIWHLI